LGESQTISISKQIRIQEKEQKMKRTGRLRRPPQKTPRLSGTQVQGISLELRACAHYFLPGADCHWYVLEYSKDLDLMFGWIEFAGRIGEFGYTSLKELCARQVFETS
jgi:hypothetical protein